jgi:hypothetical protein
MEETKLRHKLKNIIAQSKVAEVKANGSSTVVEHLLHQPEVQGLNPAVGNGREKCAIKKLK